jgi:hypothetical protein
VQGLGNSRYVSSFSLVSTVEGLGTSRYVSSFSLVSTVEGLGTSRYVSSFSLVSTVQGLGKTYISSFINVPSIGIATTPTTGFLLDVNGPAQMAVYYSTITTCNITIIPRVFGVFYDIKANGPYSIELNSNILLLTQNIGKYNVFRNNSGNSLSLQITYPTLSGGGEGIASPLRVADKQGVSFLVASTSNYALF